MATEQRPTAPRDFLAQYHADVIAALPEDQVEKFRLRLGANLLQPFVDSLPGQTLPPEDLKARLEVYLRGELQMAESVEMQVQGDEVTVEMRGCHLCFGNDRLRAQGKAPLCPFAPGINRALSKAVQGGTRLEGVEKPTGKTGECLIRYHLGG